MSFTLMTYVTACVFVICGAVVAVYGLVEKEWFILGISLSTVTTGFVLGTLAEISNAIKKRF